MFKEPESSSSLFYVTYIIMYMLCFSQHDESYVHVLHMETNAALTQMYLWIYQLTRHHTLSTHNWDWSNWLAHFIRNRWMKYIKRNNENAKWVAFVCELKMSGRSRPKPLALTMPHAHFVCTVCSVQWYTGTHCETICRYVECKYMYIG